MLVRVRAVLEEQVHVPAGPEIDRQDRRAGRRPQENTYRRGSAGHESQMQVSDGHTDSTACLCLLLDPASVPDLSGLFDLGARAVPSI